MSDTTREPVAWRSFPEHTPPPEVCIEIRLRCGRKFFGANEGTDGLTDEPVFVIDSRHHPDGESVPCDEVAAWRLHRPTLTDAERETLEALRDSHEDAAVWGFVSSGSADDCRKVAATLRALLARLDDPRATRIQDGE